MQLSIVTIRLVCVFGMLLMTCVNPMLLFSQNDDFQRRYEDVYMRLIATDVNEAKRATDSLVSVAADEGQKAKALMLLANIHYSLGDLSEVIVNVLEVQQIANKNRNAEWQARSSGFLASTFRTVGLLEESKRHLDQAEEANERQKDASGYITTKVNILQERTFHAMEDSLYAEALAYLEKGDKYLAQQSNSDDARLRLTLTTNDQLKAVCYLHTGDITLADSLLDLSLQRMGNEESNLRSYIYRAKAEAALQKGQYDSTYYYLTLAEPYIDSSQRQELKLLLYGTFARYYQAIGDHAQAVHYNELYQAVSHERIRYARQISNELVRKLNEEKQRYSASVRYGWMVFFGVVVLMGSILTYLFVKQRKERKIYLQLIHDLENEQRPAVDVSGQIVNMEKKTKEESGQDKEMAISAETENRLLAALERLEETAFFLDKDISLTTLSTKLNTNQRYVSFIIRKYRDMDFNSYVQHYRIHYIMNRIKLEPDLLEYKLSYLADLAGFSSHSKFSAVFKAVTGIPPSVFIHYTKEELGR